MNTKRPGASCFLIDDTATDFSNDNILGPNVFEILSAGNTGTPGVWSSITLEPVVDLAGGITNALFAGNPGSCPTGWICTGSPAPGFASYAPTTAQYPGGSPFPTSASGPTVYAGSGVIRQLTPLTWVAGTTYVLLTCGRVCRTKNRTGQRRLGAGHQVPTGR